jgi:hypothetical protein
MPRHPRLRNRGRPSSAARRPRGGSQIDRAAALRSLIQAGIVSAAALAARNDLGAAAISMQWLGSLTSGMWRALSGELVTAAERLDRQSDEYLDNVYRRAQALEVVPDAVLAAGAAAGHLAEHRETLESLLPGLEEEVRRLAAPEVILGFSVDDAVLLEDEELETDEFDTDDDDDIEEVEDDSGDDVPGLAVDVWLFTWPAPLSPVRVRIVPDIAAVANDTATDLSVSFGVSGDESTVEALSTSCGMPRESIPPALSALGLACWSAHQADEHVENEDDDANE